MGSENFEACEVMGAGQLTLGGALNLSVWIKVIRRSFKESLAYYNPCSAPVTYGTQRV
jgi:hypothetical protein